MMNIKVVFITLFYLFIYYMCINKGKGMPIYNNITSQEDKDNTLLDSYFFEI